MSKSLLHQYRDFLTSRAQEAVDFGRTDQQRGVAPPPLEKPPPAEGRRVALVPPGGWQAIEAIDLAAAVGRRESRRSFSAAPLSLEELSFLLWATQGIRRPVDRATALRMVPSAGARHALETHLCVFRVEGLPPAFYRYLPLEHELLLEFEEPKAAARLTAATWGQSFAARAAVTFIWTAIPYRMEWRYGLAAAKFILLDAGHVAQNLYLACEAIGAGVCAIAAYNQELMDELVRVDGQEELVIYLAPVGKR